MTWTAERLEQTTRILAALSVRQWPENRDGFRADLIQTAWMRLLQEEFDETRGVPFGAWVTARARWAMQDAARSQGWNRRRGESMVVGSLDAQAPSGDAIWEMYGDAPTYPDPFLAARIHAAFRDLPDRLKPFLLACLRKGGRRETAHRFGVNESRGTQLAQKARERFRHALRQRGVAA